MMNLFPSWGHKKSCHIKSENHNYRMYHIKDVYFRKMKEYSEDEQTDLNEMFDGVAHTECFAVVFEESFGAYMMNTIDAMAGLGLDLNLK